MDKEKYAFIKQHTPCYLYDAAVISSQCHSLQAAFPACCFLYSLKTNPFMPLVEQIVAAGFGADAASAGEVQLAADCGVAANDIYYSAPGKTKADIEAVWGQCVIIADSLHELELIDKAAAERGCRVQIGLRLNPDFSCGSEAILPSKFGVDAEQLFAAKSLLKQYCHLQVVGIHIHLRSQVLDAAILGDYYEHCFELARRLTAVEGLELRFINFGSGIGAVYDEARDKPVDFQKLSSAVARLAAENANTIRARLLLETGRFVVCNAGTYYTRIADIKESRGTKYVIVEDGFNSFMRPAIANLLRMAVPQGGLPGFEPLYTSPYACPCIVVNDAVRQERVDIVGSLCTAMDVLANDVLVNEPSIEDIVAVGNAGSYAYSLSPQLFAGKRLPVQFIWGAHFAG